MISRNRRSAFTLIELIITIVILGGLVTIGMIKYPASVQRARDVQRQNDLKNYQNALELYAMKHHGFYPTSGYIPLPTLCPVLGMDTQSCKNDPKGGTYYYETNSSGTKYTTWSSMEKTANSFVVCSGGMNGLAAVTPAAGVCPTFEVTVNPVEGTPAPTNTSAPPTNTPIPTNTPTPTPTPVLNSNSNSSCITKCSALGKTCSSIGTDVSATNNMYYNYTSSTCNQTPGDPGTLMTKNSPNKCNSIMANWTYCKCQ